MKIEFLNNVLLRWCDAWDRFWFADVSTSAIAVFRILLGMLLIQYALLLMPDLYVWFGQDGIVTSTAINGWQTHIRLNILNLFPNSDLWLNTVFTIFVLSAISLTIGLKTRLSAVLVFVCLSSLHARNYLILNSGDVFMRMLCFWLIFSAAGKSLSIDSWLKGKRRAAAEGHVGVALATRKHNGRLKPPLQAAPWAQRLIQINLSLLYAQAFANKIIGSDWQNGTAVYFSSRMAEMQKFPLHCLFDHLWICQLLSWTVLGIELSLCTLIWVKPFRYYVLILGVIMHLSIDWTMNIPQFEWIMMVSYVLFIEPTDMDRLLNWFMVFFKGRGRCNRPANISG